MKESRKPLEARIGYKIYRFMENHTAIFFIMFIALTMGIMYLIFSISQQEAYEIALASYDKKQYENLNEAITKNMQNGFPNISEVPEDIEFAFNKPGDSDNIIYIFSQEVKDRKSWIVPDLTITVEISKSGELLSKTSCYETEESYRKRIQDDYTLGKVLISLLASLPVMILILLVLLPFTYYWEKKEREKAAKEFAEFIRGLVACTMDLTSEDDEQEDIRLIEDEPEDNDE